MIRKGFASVAGIGMIVLNITGTQMAGAAEPAPPTYELGDIIELTLERNPAVVGAQGFIEESQGRQVASGAYPNPTVGGGSGTSVIRDPDGPRIYNKEGFLSQPFEWPGKRAARQRVADAGVAGAYAGLDVVRLNLIADVKVAFYELLVAQRELELARQNLNIVDNVARAVKVRVLSGEAPQFESIKADVEVMKANQIVTQARNVVRVARVTLDTFTAGALGTTYAIRGDFATFPRKKRSLDALTVLALERHPTIQRILKRVEKAGHRVVFEREARVPNVTLWGAYQRNAGQEAWITNLSLPMPIWYQRQGEILAALGLQRQEEAELLRTRNDLVRSVTQHYEEARTAQEQIELFEKGLIALAEEALRIAQFSFQQGASSLLEVLDAQRVFRDTQLNYARARFDLSLALARLERAVGGPL